MLEQALEIASHITYPVTLAAFVAAFLGIALLHQALKAKKPKIAGLAAAMVVVGLFPLAGSIYVRTRNVYHVRVVVLGPGGMAVDGANVISSSGGEPAQVKGGWEFVIPPQTRPADGVVTFFVAVPSAFLSGHSQVVLARDYYPTITIPLTPDTSAILRGAVVDEHRRPVGGATVSIVGYTDSTVTNNMGNFALPAHAADGQIVQVRAQKGRMVGSVSVPAGREPVEVTVRLQ